jgi:hypothetical protein
MSIWPKNNGVSGNMNAGTCKLCKYRELELCVNELGWTGTRSSAGDVHMGAWSLWPADRRPASVHRASSPWREKRILSILDRDIPVSNFEHTSPHEN